MTKLNFTIHSRKFDNLIYIYPVISRRSQGLSLGINLNVNKACNWRCIYCQVDGLVRGNPNDINLEQLESELDYMLQWIIKGDFLKLNAPINLQRFNDIAISGDGESTLSKQFLDVVNIIAKLRIKYQLADNVKTILITNGSEIDGSDIIQALKIINQNNGEIWFKVDSATPHGIKQINQVNLSINSLIKRLKLSASQCNTYIQTCIFRINQIDPEPQEINAYLDFLKQVKPHIAGVLLYSTARKPAIPEGVAVSQVNEAYLEDLANKIASLDIAVKYYL